MHLHCMALDALWQVLGPSVTLTFYLNGPHALLNSERVPESNKLSVLWICGLSTVYTDYSKTME